MVNIMKQDLKSLIGTHVTSTKCGGMGNCFVPLPDGDGAEFPAIKQLFAPQNFSHISAIL